MVSFAQAIPDARDIINDFNNDIDVFLEVFTRNMIPAQRSTNQHKC